jgi:peptidoglycan/xylan/chitin deacetylase (PgdA/CDA1 family)
MRASRLDIRSDAIWCGEADMWSLNVPANGTSFDALVDAPHPKAEDGRAGLDRSHLPTFDVKPREQVGFIFHGIGEPPAHVPSEERPYWVSTALFRDIVRAMSAGSFEREVVVTVDDGNKSDLFAAEEFDRAGIKALFFPLTGRMGFKDYLTAAEARQIAMAGMEIGLHGHSHLNWRRIRSADWQVELVDARARIADATGKPVRSVAIPYGAYDRAVLKQLAHYRFDRIYNSDAGPTPAWSTIIRRTPIKSDFSVQRIVDIIEDRTGLLARARRKIAPLIKSWR